MNFNGNDKNWADIFAAWKFGCKRDIPKIKFPVSFPLFLFLLLVTPFVCFSQISMNAQHHWLNVTLTLIVRILQALLPALADPVLLETEQLAKVVNSALPC